MSAMHAPHEWTSSEALAATNREVPSWVTTLTRAMFGIGLVVFIVGVIVAPDPPQAFRHAARL